MVITDITSKIDRLHAIKDQQSQLKNEADKIEAELLQVATEDLANTKYKSVKYAGTDCKMMATVADNVKITYATLLPLIFGECYTDMVKVSERAELTAPAKRLLAGLWTGNYVAGTTVDEVIKSLNQPEKAEKLLLKKCKGINYQKDIDNLITIAGLTEEQAQENAYLLAEANIWQQFETLMRANNITDEQSIKDIMAKIQAAVVVEQSTKISLEG
jgi:hypothetical protein